MGEENIFNLAWTPSTDVKIITTIDTHTAGEPLRIPINGLPKIEGKTVLEKRRYFMQNYDYLRTGLLLEPRGHNDMYGAILSRSFEGNSLDVFFINTEGYSPMCGHAILAIAVVAFTTEILGKNDPTRDLVLQTPAGPNYARIDQSAGQTTEAFFRNVPSFVYLLNKTVQVPVLGDVSFDIAFGGAFYAFVDAEALRLKLDETNASAIVSLAQKIKPQILANSKIEHPFEPDLSSLFGVIFVGKAHDSKNHSRNVNVFEDNQVDRSPTGTGVSARCALHVAKGELKLGEKIVIESIIGSTMSVRAVQATKFGPYEAVIPEVGGTANLTGKHELYFSENDQYKAGFSIR